MFPTLPSKIDSELETLRTNIIGLSASLGSGLHPQVVAAIANLMLNVNSYYTNAMEGNPSLLGDIQKALDNDLSADTNSRNYQMEHLAHIATQKKMLERIDREKNLDICSIDFLCWIHKEFYLRLPEEMRCARAHDGTKLPVLPGMFRDRSASVRRHLPPNDLDEVKTNIVNFSRDYSPANVDEPKKLCAMASSHHRLLWIHPFRDGNGRVARLFTIAYQHKLGIDSRGLWTVTRAFARNRPAYDHNLSLADQPRRNDFDGRGPLSEENLVLFCKYFLAECVDQLKFMASILELHHMEKRFAQYLALMQYQKRISKLAAQVLKELFYKGEIERGEIQKICGIKRRRGTEIIKELLDKKLAQSNSPHGKLNLYFTDESALHLFPKLV